MRRRTVKHLILSSMVVAGITGLSLASTPDVTHAHVTEGQRHIGFDAILGYGCWFPGCGPMEMCCSGNEQQS